LLGCGYEWSRSRTAQSNQRTISWTERVLLVWSQAYATQQETDLGKRVAQACRVLRALQAAPKQGRRVYRSAEGVLEAAQKVLEQQRVTGLITITAAAVGSAEQPRYRLATVQVDMDAFRHTLRRLGWRVYLTNALVEELPLPQAILTYRGMPAGIERFFHLLKGRPLGLHPLFVHTKAQICGLMYLLTLAARILTYIQGLVRATLREHHGGLTHLILNNLKKAVTTPTIRQLLDALCRCAITLVTTRDADGAVHRYLTAIPEVVNQILRAMRLPADTYTRLIDYQ